MPFIKANSAVPDEISLFYFMLVDTFCIYRMLCKIIQLLVSQAYVISILLWSSLVNVFDRSTSLIDIILRECFISEDYISKLYQFDKCQTPFNYPII